MIPNYKQPKQEGLNKMSNVPQLKSLNIRLPREVWIFLKKISAENDTSMNSYIIERLLAAKQRYEKKELTNSGADV
jgi:hypothetical protein